jgi:hypothetical protein
MRRKASEVIRSLESRVAYLESGVGGVLFLDLSKNWYRESNNKEELLFSILDEAYGELLRKGRLFLKDPNGVIQSKFRNLKHFQTSFKEDLVRFAEDKAHSYDYYDGGIDSFEGGMAEEFRSDVRKISRKRLEVEQVTSPKDGSAGFKITMG